MISAIDHIAIGVPDPDAAAAQLTDQLGIAFTAGGRHPSFGTFNRLAFLGDTFLELIGVADPALAAHGPVGTAALRAIEGGGGLATYALLDDAIETTWRRSRPPAARSGRSGTVAASGRTARSSSSGRPSRNA